MYIAIKSLYATVVIKATLQAKHLAFLIIPMYILNTEIKNKYIKSRRISEKEQKLVRKSGEKNPTILITKESPKTIYYFFLG